MNFSPDVSIIIASFEGDVYLRKCVQSIVAHTTVSFEIIIVGKSNLPPEPLAIQIINLSTNIGAAPARNKAAVHSKGRYLIFLDYDTVVDNGWLKNVISYLNNHKDIGGGQLKLMRADRRQVFDSAGDLLTSFGFLAERAQEAKDIGQYNKVTNIFSSKGAAMIVRRSVFNEIGGFDNDYFMYWEEPDLTWRIWKRGYRYVFLPMGTVFHAFGSKENQRQKKIDHDTIAKITYFGCRNHILTIFKNGIGMAGFKMLLTVILAWIGLLLLFLIKLDRRRAYAVILAFAYLVTSGSQIVSKRKDTIKKIGNGYYLDQDWLHLVSDNRTMRWYIGKALAYITNKPY